MELPDLLDFFNDKDLQKTIREKSVRDIQKGLKNQIKKSKELTDNKIPDDKSKKEVLY